MDIIKSDWLLAGSNRAGVIEQHALGTLSILGEHARVKTSDDPHSPINQGQPSAYWVGLCIFRMPRLLAWLPSSRTVNWRVQHSGPWRGLLASLLKDIGGVGFHPSQPGRSSCQPPSGEYRVSPWCRPWALADNATPAKLNGRWGNGGHGRIKVVVRGGAWWLWSRWW